MKTKITVFKKDVATNLLGCHDLKVILPNKKDFIYIGRGSVKTLSKIRLFNSLPELNRNYPILKIGRFCEFAMCNVMIAGVHENNVPVNITFASFPLLNFAARNLGLSLASSQLSSNGATEIGDNVVLSLNSTVVSGAAVPTGSVVAAHGVVTSRLTETFGIFGGVPAKLLRKRHLSTTEATCWWDWSYDDISTFLRTNIPPVNPEIHSNRARVVCTTKDQNGILILDSVVGFDTEGKFVRMSDASNKLQTYFSQLQKEGDIENKVQLSLETELLRRGHI